MDASSPEGTQKREEEGRGEAGGQEEDRRSTNEHKEGGSPDGIFALGPQPLDAGRLEEGRGMMGRLLVDRRRTRGPPPPRRAKDPGYLTITPSPWVEPIHPHRKCSRPTSSSAMCRNRLRRSTLRHPLVDRRWTHGPPPPEGQHHEVMTGSRLSRRVNARNLSAPIPTLP